MNCILLRYGEIGLKSKQTRTKLERLYKQAIEEALQRNKIVNYTLKNLSGRFVLYTENLDSVDVLKRIPGIQSVSPASFFTFENKEDLLVQFKERAFSLVKDKIFAIKVKRVGSHGFTSMEIAKEAADTIYDNSKGVNLTSPEIVVYLEIRNKEVYVYTKILSALGGLPPYPSNKALCLFSGGIDSPVAALQMLKRGCAVDFVHIDFLGEKVFNDVAQVYNYLIYHYAYNYQPRMFLIDGKEIMKKIQKEVPDSLKQIAVKIVFYQLAERLARKEHHFVIITGEALSQKSSQTLQSLTVINSQIIMPVLRPLIGMDKIEIMKVAREMGTLAFSERIKEYCNLAIGKVATAPTIGDLNRIPSFQKEVDTAVEEVKGYQNKIEVETKSEMTILNDNITIETNRNSNKFISVDIRSKSLQKSAHLNTDLQISFPEVLDYDFDKDKKYLIVCDFGVKSESVAHNLNKKGITVAGITINNYLKYFGGMIK